ncbi:hypothetical protein C8R48DRAFT_777062 [Suillus tomentosus]|nr:hypothetical protein C8R48DRAFT_777062 [Suillus tomentosus]
MSADMEWIQEAMQYVGEHGAVSVVGNMFDEIVGKGVKADFKEKRHKVIVGNKALMQDHDVLLPPDVLQVLDRWKSEAKSIVLLTMAHLEGAPSL